MTENKKSWFVRHKVLSVVIALVIIGAIAGAANSNKSNTETVNNSNSNTSQPPQSSTPSASEKMTVSNSTYSANSGLYQVVGEVENNDTTQHSATLKATFYDASGKITGTASGAVNDVAPGDTKTFTLLSTTDVTGYANMKVQVDTLL